jgi:phosphatidylglycerophosphate synthase
MELSPKLSSELLDPVNRLYRHRVAKALANLIKNTPITPNLLTMAHTVVGVFAAILIYFQHYILAVFCFELRTLLDCMDGILARLKNQSTAFGRVLDTIGDAIAFNSLMIAGAMRMIIDFPSYRPSLILISVFCFAMIAAQSGGVYQLMKRKLGSIILSQVDTVEREWREHSEVMRGPNPSWISQFGFWLDTMTIRFISEEWYEKINRRRTASDWEARALQDAATMNELAKITRRREFINAVRFTAFVSDDNIFAVMSICFLILGTFPDQIFPNVHPVLVAFAAGLVFALVALLLGLHFLHKFLHGVYRE